MYGVLFEMKTEKMLLANVIAMGGTEKTYKRFDSLKIIQMNELC